MGYSRLLWTDVETTGLRVDRDRLLSVGVLLTGPSLEIEACMEVDIWCPQADIDGMDPVAKDMHTKSGLLDRCVQARMGMHEAEEEIMNFLKANGVRPKSLPMCGNSVQFDRRFLAKWMPTLEAEGFHYSNIDVTTVRRLVRIYRPELEYRHPTETAHTALADLHKSICELKHYRDNFFRLME